MGKKEEMKEGLHLNFKGYFGLFINKYSCHQKYHTSNFLWTFGPKWACAGA